jgi:hypothetical protein
MVPQRMHDALPSLMGAPTQSRTCEAAQNNNAEQVLALVAGSEIFARSSCTQIASQIYSILHATTSNATWLHECYKDVAVDLPVTADPHKITMFNRSITIIIVYCRIMSAQCLFAGVQE